MKNLFAKCLAALLVAALLLSPVALMEETPVEPVEAENVTNEAEDATNEAESVTNEAEDAEAETVTNEAEDVATEDAHEEEATEEIVFEDVDEAIEEEDLAELEAEEEYFGEAEEEFVSSDAMDALYGAEPTPDVDGSGNIKLNDTNFPDENFLSYIVDNFDNAPKDGVLSDSELQAITEITIPQSVTDATGVKLLKYLQKLY